MRFRREHVQELIEAAKDAAFAIESELVAAGEEDVSQHPTLLGHRATAERVRAAIDALERPAWLREKRARAEARRSDRALGESMAYGDPITSGDGGQVGGR